MFFLYGCATLKNELINSNSNGERLYRQKCASCHTLVSKERYNEKEWIGFVEEFGNNINLTSEEKNKILQYLTK